MYPPVPNVAAAREITAMTSGAEDFGHFIGAAIAIALKTASA
jgi:hypothetical protein